VPQADADNALSEWLEGQRAIYAQLTAELESRVLTVSDETVRMHGSDNKQFMAWQVVDDRLVELPSTLCEAAIESPPWTYTLDLDREVFSVDMWIHFSMEEIPRIPDDRWIEGFQKDDAGGKVFSFDICPEATDTQPTVEYFPDNDSRDEYEAKYRQYECSVVNAMNNIEESSRVAHGRTVSLILFERFISSFAFWFEEYIPGWSHEDFGFREFAFAILSFAARQYRLDRPDRFRGEISNGYLVDPDNDEVRGSEPNLLPVFAAGCHSPGKEAGSAPQASIYWFEDVLVSLVPDTAFRSGIEAAIAKVVESGREEGKPGFQAMILSLTRVVMLQVSVKNRDTVVKRNRW